MDEPTLGLDAAVRKEFYNILLKDYMENPRTIIISSHLLSEIENLLEEIVLIKDGTLVLHKPMEELQEYAVYLNGRSDIVRTFIEKKQVLNTETFGNSIVAAVRNDLTADELAFLSDNSIDVSKVRVEDVCIFLTKSGKEGVFDEN
jgi:ABC-2 type transport system ATP-binding protein